MNISPTSHPKTLEWIWGKNWKKIEKVNEKKIQKNLWMIGLVVYLQTLLKSDAKYLSY